MIAAACAPTSTRRAAPIRRRCSSDARTNRRCRSLTTSCATGSRTQGRFGWCMSPARLLGRRRELNCRKPKSPRRLNAWLSTQEPGIEISDVAPVERALLSDESAATVASKFQALAAGVAFSESDILDRCAKEMLQPILQQWLEANLPIARGAAGARRNRTDRAACKPSCGLGAQIESALTTL